MDTKKLNSRADSSDISNNFWDDFFNYLLDNKIIYKHSYQDNKFYFSFKRKYYDSLLKSGKAELKDTIFKLDEDQFNYLKKFKSGKELLNALKYHLEDPPKCPYCGNPRKYNENSTGSASFSRYFETCASRSCHQKQIEKINMERYGVKNQSFRPEILEKIEKSNLEKYGTKAPAQNEFIKNKMYDTWEAKYGNRQYFKSEDFKNKSTLTCLRHWGVDHPWKSKEGWSLAKEGFLKKYGVENASQIKEFQDKKSKRYFYKNLYFDSSIELELYIYCEDYNIPFTYKPDALSYTYEGKIHKYYPDFIINGRYVEVKGNILLDENNHLIPHPGEIKNLSKEDLEYQRNLLKAKEECMINNNVYILKEKSEDHLRIKDYIYNRYGNKYIASFKKK